MKLQVFGEEEEGYHFGRRMTDIYNPFSILNACKSCYIDDYWFSSGTPSYLVRLLNHFQENMNELTNRYYTTQQFIDYKADVEMPFPMIYQSGYLTIKDYNIRRNTYLLDFPNDEVKLCKEILPHIVERLIHRHLLISSVYVF